MAKAASRGGPPIPIRSTGDWISFTVRVSPGASREGVTGLHGGALKVAVRERPERGRATRAVIRAVAEFLGVRPSQVEVVSGQVSRLKRLRVRGARPERVLERIRRLEPAAGEG